MPLKTIAMIVLIAIATAGCSVVVYEGKPTKTTQSSKSGYLEPLQ
jgi:PBP1b-binding outer membrane lipoprotein LpoB